MNRKSLSLWAPILVMAAALVMLAVSVDVVDAARGGKGKGGTGGGGGGDTAPSVTMSVSPNPVPAWGTVYKISGTGFAPGAGVNFVQNGVATFTTADASGFATSTWMSWYPGTYTAYAKQLTSKGYVAVGSITFSVQ